MILDVYPSSKDTEMVDLLYEFERDTRLSLNILVENYLEKLLYDEGYLPMGLNKKEESHSNDGIIGNHESFTIKPNGRSKTIYCSDLCFGNHKLEDVEWIVDELNKLPHETLKELCNKNWNKENGIYGLYLKKKLKNPSLTIGEFKRESQFRCSYLESRGVTQIKRAKDNFSFGSFKGKDTPDIKKARDYFITAPIEEINELQQKLVNEKNRSKITLKWISEKEGK